MTSAQPTVAHRFATAFTARDLDGVLGCFTPDARYHDLFYGTVSGHDRLRRMFARMYAEGERQEWTMTKVVEGAADCTVGEWLFSVTTDGRSLRYPGISLFETVGGRCHTYREHFDRAAVLLALGVPPDRTAALVARRSTVRVLEPGGPAC